MACGLLARMVRAKSPLPVATSSTRAACHFLTISPARRRHEKSSPPLSRWLARSYRRAIAEKSACTLGPLERTLSMGLPFQSDSRELKGIKDASVMVNDLLPRFRAWRGGAAL